MKGRLTVESSLVALALTLCDSATAQTQCTPDCAGKQCGDDGCGGQCGDCAAGQTCVVDQCVWGCGNIGSRGCCYKNHAVFCDDIHKVIDKVTGCSEDNGKECGWKSYSDGWGHYVCVATPGLPDPSGTYPMECDFSCTPKCEGVECGGDQCGGSCGECAEGQVCFLGSCCERECAGKDCGYDGCGGDCGECGEGFWCTDFFKCAYGYGCEQTSFPGCKGCACLGCVCGMDPWCCSVEWDWKCSYECQFDCGGCVPCEPRCEGKTCGDDGCGGACGTCPDGQTCQEGSCMSLPGEDVHPADDQSSADDHAGEDKGEVQQTLDDRLPEHGAEGVAPFDSGDVIQFDPGPATDAGRPLDRIALEETPLNDTSSGNDRATMDSMARDDRRRDGGGGCRHGRSVPANTPGGILFLVIFAGWALRQACVGRGR